jgi:hypothetical protein
METAQSVDDIMELRKQQTRRRVTYIVVAVLYIASAYLIVQGSNELRSAALSGLLGLARPIIGFYFGAKQTGE